MAFLLGIVDVFAQGPPPPAPPPPPPGLPIDENMVMLFVVALLFGFYVIYNYKLKTKPSE